MKKIVCAALALILIFSVCAMAEEESLGIMQVVNCDEWVSLRAEPRTSADRVAKVPLGEYVYNCEYYSDEFVYAEYEERCGFILAKYLTPVENRGTAMEASIMTYDELMGTDADVILDSTYYGYRVIASREYMFGDGNKSSEVVRVGCFINGKMPVWGWKISTDFLTELNATDAFVGGSEEYAQVMIYNSTYGLMAVDYFDGTENWMLSAHEVSLGGSICHAVAPDGIMYIAGYYGPDPVAITMDGQVLWMSDCGDSGVYWPYAIDIYDDSIVCHYDSGAGNDIVFYSLDGEMLWASNTADAAE